MINNTLLSDVNRIADHLVNSIYNKIQIKWLQRKYKNNSYNKTIDWQWDTAMYNRIALVNHLVSKKKDCSYLEIGCNLDDLYKSVIAPYKVGVDPKRGGSIRQTSDEFFKTNKLLFDVIFIDGLHTYEQTRKDAINAIKFLKPGGWIAFHDMLPSSWLENHVPVITQGVWTGDVWKLAFELIKSEGIEFKIIKIDNGVGVLKINKDKPVVADMTEELSDKQYSYFYENISKLPIAEWDSAQDWLNNK